MKKLLCVTLILLGVFQSAAQKPAWLTKLETLHKSPWTEKDFEKLFSPKVTEILDSPKIWGKVVHYEVPEGKFLVYYSTGRCGPENKDGFNLDYGVIVNLDFSLNEPMRFSKLKLKLNDFIKSRENDIEIWFYTNLEKGITYTVFDDKLTSITLRLPKKYRQSCENLISQPK
jgi:hypothetical protein